MGTDACGAKRPVRHQFGLVVGEFGEISPSLVRLAPGLEPSLRFLVRFDLGGNGERREETGVKGEEGLRRIEDDGRRRGKVAGDGDAIVRLKIGIPLPEQEAAQQKDEHGQDEMFLHGGEVTLAPIGPGKQAINGAKPESKSVCGKRALGFRSDSS